MQKSNLNIELKKDSYDRIVSSCVGHIILVCVFFGISKNYLLFFKEFLYLGLTIAIVNIFRLVITKIYFSKNQNIIYSKYIDFTTLCSGFLWGMLFNIVYLKIGLYQAPSIALYVIIAGIASAASSSLYAQKNLLTIFLIFTIVIPGCAMIYNEIIITEKLFGVLILTFYGFLTSQANLNRKNLIARLELNHFLADEATRIDQLFNSVPGIFCYFHINDKILASNQMWKDFSKSFGNQLNFSHGIDNRFMDAIKGFINSSDEKLSIEFQFLVGENICWYICSAQKVVSTNSILLFMMDISSLKKIQEEMKLKDAHIQHSARLIELGEMVGSIAHEINNPLTIVLGRAKVTKKMIESNLLVPEKMFSNLELIETSVQRISTLVNGMKSLVRNSENDTPTNQSLEAHLEIVKFLVLSKAELQKVELIIEINTTDLFGLCRPSQIEQVLMNLINNAIDAAKLTTDKWVRLSITSNDQYLVFEIVDSGNGISEDLLKKIWNPFFTTKELGHGTGLGLSISHTIILENNGNIFYRANSSNTTFVVEIPKLKLAA